MSEELARLIEASKRVPASAEQLEKQRRSFAYGNTRFENERITWERIDRAAEELKSSGNADDGTAD